MVCAQDRPSRTKRGLCAGAISYIRKLWPLLLFSLSLTISAQASCLPCHAVGSKTDQWDYPTSLHSLILPPSSTSTICLLLPCRHTQSQQTTKDLGRQAIPRLSSCYTGVSRVPYV